MLPPFPLPSRHFWWDFDFQTAAGRGQASVRQGLIRLLKHFLTGPSSGLWKGERAENLLPFLLGSREHSFPHPQTSRDPLLHLLSLLVMIGLRSQTSLWPPLRKSHIHGATPLIEHDGGQLSDPPGATSRGFTASVFRMFLILQALNPVPSLLLFLSLFGALPLLGAQAFSFRA